MTVVMTEIPGMSRFGHPIPKAVRSDMLRRRPRSWATLTVGYAAAALEARGVAAPVGPIHALGYSTGCSLAVEAGAALAQLGPVEEVTLVEPVAISERLLTTLQAHNTIEWLREHATQRTNARHDWVVHARNHQAREPRVRYSTADLHAIARVLATSGLTGELSRLDVPRCNLVRGDSSALCPTGRFQELDAILSRRGIPGDTVTVTRLGHQLWHSFPAIVPLLDLLLGAGRASEARS